MRIVDTHCHLNNKDFADDLDSVIARAAEAGVDRLVVIAWDWASSADAVALTSRPGIHATVGIHPESAAEWSPETRAALSALIAQSSGRVAGYGEIGLDYHWESVPRDRQQLVFAEQIAFAQSVDPDLPLVIHCRDAFADVLAVLQEASPACPVILHCFTGDLADAKSCLDFGYYLGFGGVLTYKKSDSVREAATYAPLDRILLETDCPYLAPQKWRGRRNEPSYIVSVAETMAACKNLTIEEIAAATTTNAERVFRLGTFRQP